MTQEQYTKFLTELKTFIKEEMDEQREFQKIQMAKLNQMETRIMSLQKFLYVFQYDVKWENYLRRSGSYLLKELEKMPFEEWCQNIKEEYEAKMERVIKL